MPQYLLDTNILLAWMRWGVLALYLQSQYHSDTISPYPIISVVSEAELRVLAVENSWGDFKMRMLEKVVSSLAPVLIPYKGSVDDKGSVDAYVILDSYRRKQGRTMGKNDLWIAATAMVEGATILTTDADFDHLPQSLVKHIYIDPSSSL